MSQRVLAVSLRAAIAAALATTGSLAAAGTSSASTTGAGVVISEVYGAGGNTGAAYDHDYVELFNPTNAPVSLAGMSVQYRSATGTGNPTGVTALTGSIGAKSYYLVAEGSGGANGAPLPTANVTGAVNMSASAGTVFLANQATALTAPPTGSVTGNPAVADLVGFGTSNTFEAAAAPAQSATTSIARDAAGKDTDSNAADLVAGPGTPGEAPGGSAEPPATALPIADIQGPTDVSPYVGQAVSTDGVVTAAYPTGGFNGFYLQTGGTGGDLDLGTHTKSDGIFVFSSAAASAVHLGDHVQVTGKVAEFNGLTELVPAAASDVSALASPAPAVKPATVAWPRTDAARESLEGMLVDLQGPFTVADNYSLNQYAEIGLASGTEPLWQPTEVADPHDAAAITAVNADNAARKVTLDDGATTNFLTTGKNTALPWLTQDHQIRVGATASFTAPLVVDYRNGLWKLQPTGQLTAAAAAPVSFAHTRTEAPAPVGGDVQIASFNVLNYFPTTGADYVASGGTCTWYDDRVGEHVTVRDCTGPNGEPGPRGAADAGDLARQQAKIVRAINGLGADVVSLEEIENSAKFGLPRDAAVSTLVDALNAAAGAGTWSYVSTPSNIGDQADEDVIRTAFLYRTSVVAPVGESVVDDAPEFDVARDPLAQTFQPVGRTSASRFVVIVNHFKSKGSGPDDGTGQGNSNPQRVAQAQQLVTFADQVKAASGTDRVFLSGDFNAYTEEDPIKVLHDAGYTDIGSHESPGEHTYLFDGVVGSLDHVLANAPALATVTGAHVWNINSVEPVALEYSRFDYNLTDFYSADPYRASDHDPLLVGLDTTAEPVATTISADVSPDPVLTAKQDREPGEVSIHVTSPRDTVDAGTVEVYDGSVLVGTTNVSATGVASLTLPAYRHKGAHALTVHYLGTPLFAPSETTVAFEVSNK
ncbi:ExeM/NucH family extracellular endonuclease [Nocardioides pocheonensis]|nr:ExeM/NucH family extracellular endonuclease [Nocardioides pocheonensis]